MVMGASARAVLGSVAVFGVLVLAGCGSSARASAPNGAEALPSQSTSTNQAPLGELMTERMMNTKKPMTLPATPTTPSQKPVCATPPFVASPRFARSIPILPMTMPMTLPANGTQQKPRMAESSARFPIVLLTPLILAWAWN